MAFNTECIKNFVQNILEVLAHGQVSKNYNKQVYIKWEPRSFWNTKKVHPKYQEFCGQKSKAAQNRYSL